MKLLFLSNFFNHHQAALCESWYARTEGDFCFVQTAPFPQEREKLGWREAQRPYIRTWDEKENAQLSETVENAQIVVWGDAPRALVRPRLKAGKPTFRYAERIFKHGASRLKRPARALRYRFLYGRYRSLYLLCAGGYTAADYVLHGAFGGKCYRWGYFPETKHYDLSALMARKKENRVLWCGRFVDWKHPQDALEAVARLRRQGIDVQLEMIGTGETENALRAKAAEYGLGASVCFCGAMSPDAVREHMENAAVFLFTSDFAEGWGAVLNEAMNSGCAVIASHAAGATPFLVENGKNGLIYEFGRVDALTNKLRFLLEDPARREALGVQAYHTITRLWNAEIAAERFLCLTRRLACGDTSEPYSDGPCAPAPILKNNWFCEEAAYDEFASQ